MSDTATKTKPVTILQAINTAIADAMEADSSVVVLGEDVADPEDGGVVGVTKGLSSRFGDHRVRSTPIAEQAIIGAAIGASLVGYKPVAEIMLMNFTTVAMDMIVNHAAKLRFMSGGQTNVPIVVRTMTGTGFGSGGQHCDYLEAWFAHTAGMKVVAPSNPADAYGLMRAAIDDPDPVLYIENLPAYWTPGAPPETGHVVPLGKAKVVKEGTDVTIVSYSRVLNEAVAAVEAMEAAGVSAEIIDLRTISPWDRETVFTSVAKTGRCLIAHEAVTQFGVGAEIAATLQSEFFGKLKAPIGRLGAPYAPVPFSKPLESAYAPDAKRIAEAAISLKK
ncbi:alpha-ketoacid dehydrogenase subunit beta [Novosphingobium taihuense]|uniref:Pyruvate dehydrogenase E1 component beta subunit n=1 Tax=Novosphingobium taihuense TaxID=260085 RepID=A0A7W7EV25_9SPHN|nr:alpha-ketoacid dehydrogenase subunit beta [Novosphingobium taihuense]MBB4615017.1 pyruvate dehydrogenase E1 component beta subunit [Novosphingobium taihuense]TWH84542.1 pyruvate dehydrogenase E1 component beta subunit [Novosphingobium taihuense]